LPPLFDGSNAFTTSTRCSLSPTCLFSLPVREGSEEGKRWPDDLERRGLLGRSTIWSVPPTGNQRVGCCAAPLSGKLAGRPGAFGRRRLVRRPTRPKEKSPGPRAHRPAEDDRAAARVEQGGRAPTSKGGSRPVGAAAASSAARALPVAVGPTRPREADDRSADEREIRGWPGERKSEQMVLEERLPASSQLARPLSMRRGESRVAGKGISASQLGQSLARATTPPPPPPTASPLLKPACQ
jgi:hypothetical protein